MATLTAAETDRARRQFAQLRTIRWTKAQANLALQAIEDTMISISNVGNRSIKTHISQQIDAVTGAFSFTANEKDDLFVIWCLINAARGGIL